MEFGSFMEFSCRPDTSEAQAFEEAFDHVALAEELGLDGVWLAEAHFSPGRAVLASPLILASTIAARTSRLKVGTAVVVLPLGNPLRIAEEAATVDQISQGRFEFGVGRSGIQSAYEGYNIPYAESRDRFWEYLDIIRQAWTTESFSYQGQFLSYSNVCVVPKHYQSPHPPLRIATTTADTFPRVGSMGIPIFIGLRVAGMPEVAAQVHSFRKAWRDAGHEGTPDVSLRVPVYVAPTKTEALSDPEESFMRQFQRLGTRLAESATKEGAQAGEGRVEHSEELSGLTWEQALREKVAVGTPEMVVERLQEMKETLGLSGVVAELNAGELIPPEGIARSLRLFCERVIPAFK